MKDNDIMNENAKATQMAEGYRKKYGDQIDALENSLLSKVEGITEFHIAQLGKQLDAFETYTSLTEANGTLNNLGVLPKIALDVITATMGQSILPVIASVQAIEAQKGIVHFKNVEYSDDKAPQSAGDIMIDPRTGTQTPDGYASNILTESAGTGDGSTTSFSFPLSRLPSRSQFLYVSAGAGVQGADQGVKGANPSLVKNGKQKSEKSGVTVFLGQSTMRQVL